MPVEDLSMFEGQQAHALASGDYRALDSELWRLLHFVHDGVCLCVRGFGRRGFGLNAEILAP